jgi:hypothetical protein
VTVRFGPQLDPPLPTPASRRTFNLELQERLAELAETTTASDLSPIRGGAEETPRAGVDGAPTEGDR